MIGLKPMAAVVGMAFTLVACTTMTKDECLTADWQAVGLADGSQGYGFDRLQDHGKACSRVGITPDRELYLTGYKRGVIAFCTPLNGYKKGMAGESLQVSCPDPQAEDFIVAYQMGQEVNRAMRQRNEVRSSLREVEDQLRAKNLPERDRWRLQDERRRLQDEIRRLDIEVERVDDRNTTLLVDMIHAAEARQGD